MKPDENQGVSVGELSLESLRKKSYFKLEFLKLLGAILSLWKSASEQNQAEKKDIIPGVFSVIKETIIFFLYLFFLPFLLIFFFC